MDENKFEKKVNELCSEIYQKLSLLIDNDYILDFQWFDITV